MQQDLKKNTGGPIDPSAGKKSERAEKQQLAAVMEIAHAINSQPDLEHILSTISSELSKVIDFDIGCVAIYEKDQSCLFIRHVSRRNGDRSSDGIYVPLDESNLVGWVAINRKPVLRNDIPNDKRFSEIMSEESLKSDIVVPLVAKDVLIGTVNIGSYEFNHFTELDLDLVTRFSKLTSIAIENSQLLKGLKELGQRYRLLMKNATDVIILMKSSGEIVECNQMT
jgi:two-component system NtrC family sensor kinase